MRISVIIPTFNGEKTIERAIKSVLNQTYKADYEIIICDDKSTDDTLYYAIKYECMIIVNDRHYGGPNKGRNNGIENASGDLVAFLDQDDEWLSDKIEKQIKHIKNGKEFVYSLCIKKEVKESQLG